MKDLSREEQISKLERLIHEKDDAFDKEQGKRVKRTFWVLNGVIYLVSFMWGEISGIKEYLTWLITVPFMAGLLMLISFGVMFYIMNGALQRAETIAKLEGELIAIKLSKYDKE